MSNIQYVNDPHKPFPSINNTEITHNEITTNQNLSYSITKPFLYNNTKENVSTNPLVKVDNNKNKS